MEQKRFTKQILFFIALIAFVLVTSYFSIKSLHGSLFSKSNSEEIAQEPVPTEADTAHTGLISLPEPLVHLFNTKASHVAKTLSTKTMISLTNKERLQMGLPALYENDLLDVSAKNKVEDMFARQYFEHKSPTGESVGENATSVGYNYILIGENLALGDFENEAGIIAAWMASEHHRDNILDPRYREIGMSAKFGNYQGNNVWMIVQHFGLSELACADFAIDVNLKDQLDRESASLAKKRKEVATQKAKVEGMSQLDPNYENEVNKYNQSAEAYNAQLENLKQKTTEYNAQVSAFNKCLDANLK